MDNGVEIRFFAAARAAAGVDQMFCASAQFQEIISEICQTRPALAHVIAQCSFLLDSVAVHDQNFVVDDGSIIDVLPRFAGG
ncbi:MAG: MoaD/ThiS family protein [Candidatus Planktophila sp.]|nr:MoaD/ThiS family protein [Candidatus Planktophila sp.]